MDERARAWLDRQEEADRKNARVIDKVTIALPRELDAVQRVELVRAFAAEVTQGRVAWLAAVHDQGKDADNPHAHVVLRDRDLQTGKMALPPGNKTAPVIYAIRSIQFEPPNFAIQVRRELFLSFSSPLFLSSSPILTISPLPSNLCPCSSLPISTQLILFRLPVCEAEST